MGITKLKYRANTGKDEDLELSQQAGMIGKVDVK